VRASGIGLGLATVLAVLSVLAFVLACAVIYGVTGQPTVRSGIPASTITPVPTPAGS
jgi:hypothetical protein